ncbi:MAG: hypothetical protein GVY36_05335 [Verrucomicrobia bacterium]|jgi:hypothetical protein|nr:hypothetical protein [Verrucomicrobiota bacterium]
MREKIYEKEMALGAGWEMRDAGYGVRDAGCDWCLPLFDELPQIFGIFGSGVRGYELERGLRLGANKTWILGGS